MRSFTLIATLIAASLIGNTALARITLSEQDYERASNAFSTLASVPIPLRNLLLSSKYREQYVSSVMRYMRRNGVDQMKLSAEGLKEKKDIAILNAKKQQRSNMLQYDNNFDGQVTLKEAKAVILQKNPNYKEAQHIKMLDNMLNSIKDKDLNKDGIISYEEMSILNENQQKQTTQFIEKQYKEYLNLDPNKDGILTGNELEELANKTFDFVDENNDGVFTDEEKKPYNLAQNVFGRHISNVPQCTLPKATEDMKILSIGVYEGETLSNVTAVGQDIETTAIKINLQEKLPPTYLLLFSDEAVMWQIQGNTDAIKQVIVGSKIVNKNNKSGSGIIGINKNLVLFTEKNCLPYYNKKKSKNFYRAKGVIKNLLGRFPDSINGIYKTGEVIIRNTAEDLTIELDGENNDPITEWKEKTEGLNKPTIPLPEGYDKNLWSSFLKVYPKGIAKINSNKVISDEKTEPYDVLPQMAGILKLIHEGKMEKVNKRHFRIIKDIPRFPAGLTGAHSVKLSIAAGIKRPEGDAGRSCVVMEQTGEILSKSSLCR